MALDVTHRLELQQLLFLDADAEAGIGLDQNFVKPEGVDPDVFHQAGVCGDDRRVGAGNAMQDFDKVSLQLMLIESSLAQRRLPSYSSKVTVLTGLSLASVPAESLVDGLVVNLDEEAEPFLRQV